MDAVNAALDPYWPQIKAMGVESTFNWYWLVELIRFGIFPDNYIYPKEVRSVRDALRRRQLFVRRRTQFILILQSLLTRYRLNAPGSRAIQQWTQADVKAPSLDPFVQPLFSQA